jgi:hypothetical protein
MIIFKRIGKNVCDSVLDLASISKLVRIRFQIQLNILQNIPANFEHYLEFC